MVSQSLVVAPGKERALVSRHQWIFSGAVRTVPDGVDDGECVDVLSSRGEFLGRAFLNRKSSIIGRMITYEHVAPEEAIAKNLHQALSYRKKLFGNLSGIMCRLVNAEADMLSGLIVDLYDTTAVIQISALGMERHRDCIVQLLRSELPLTWIYEKSTSPSRKREGLVPKEGTLWGKEQQRITVNEEELRFAISVKEGQKTGFFIDQRETRGIVRRLSAGRRVLNCFSYSGAFSVAALSGGATSCCSIDVSEGALALLQENLALNEMGNDGRHTSVCADVFAWLEKEPVDFDLVILDPPAFAKRKQDLPSALAGYREINRRVMQKVPPGSFLLTCSCSYHVSPEDFMRMLTLAALDSRRQIKVVSHHRHAWDHPTSIFHPETDYLKSALLYIS